MKNKHLILSLIIFALWLIVGVLNLFISGVSTFDYFVVWIMVIIYAIEDVIEDMLK